MTSEVLDGEERKPINFTLPRHSLAIPHCPSFRRRVLCHQFDDVNCLAMSNRTTNFGLTVIFRG